MDYLLLHCPIAFGLWSVVYGFLLIWYTLGYATVGYGFVNIFGGQFWLESYCCYMEDGAALLDAVYLAGEMLVFLRDVKVLAVSLSCFSFTSYTYSTNQEQ